MKNKFKFIGLIAIMILIGFSMTACEPEADIPDPFSVTITGVSDYIGLRAGISFEFDSDVVATGNVTSVSAGSLSFQMYDPVTEEKFEAAGVYDISLFFAVGNLSFTYTILNKKIDDGKNTIALSAFGILDPAIYVHVTGNFSVYDGWEALMGFSKSDMVAYCEDSVDVDSSTTFLIFPMMDETTDLPFDTEGTYDIILWFEKLGKDDVDYVIESRPIKKGLNTIALSEFTKLTGDDEDEDGELPIGTWYPIGNVGDINLDDTFKLLDDGTGKFGDFLDITWTVEGDSLIVTWLDGSSVEQKDVYTYSLSSPDGLSYIILTLSINGKTANYFNYKTSSSGWPSNDVWADEYNLSGLSLPAGANVFYVDTSEPYYTGTGYRVQFSVGLTADTAMFNNIITQLGTLGINTSGLDDGVLLDFYEGHDSYYYGILISYIPGFIFINIDKPTEDPPPPAVYGDWEKDGDPTRAISIWGYMGLEFWLDGTMNSYFEYMFYNDSTISVEDIDESIGEWGDWVVLFFFTAIVDEDNDTLTISGLGVYESKDFSDFNGTYSRKN